MLPLDAELLGEALALRTMAAAQDQMQQAAGEAQQQLSAAQAEAAELREALAWHQQAEAAARAQLEAALDHPL